MQLKVFFFGSSFFAIPSLEALLKFQLSTIVVTRPDKRGGRGKKFLSTPVKNRAIQSGLPVWEPENLMLPEIFLKFKEEKPDLIISAAYGQYIPVEILKLPALGAINLHPSLLPRYRGAAPVQRALMAGETMTGITLATMKKEWDSGDILLQKDYPISADDNAGTVLEKLALEGANLLKQAIPLLAEGKMKAVPQDHAKATYAPAIKKEETWICWEDPAAKIANLVRGLAPEPGARTRLQNIQIKILEARVFENGEPAKAGVISKLEKEGPVVICGAGSLVLTKVQPESRGILNGKDFINGYRLQAGGLFQNKCS